MIQPYEDGELSQHALRNNHKLHGVKSSPTLLSFTLLTMKKFTLFHKRVKKIIKALLHLQFITMPSIRMIKSCNL